MNIRQQQIESTLMRAISRIIATRLSDPRIAGLVSVTRVRFDMARREATVYVSVLPQKYERRAIQGLEHAAGRIQSLLGKEVTLRSVPQVVFALDQTLKKQDELYRAIDRGLAREGRDSSEDRESVGPELTGNSSGPEEPSW